MASDVRLKGGSGARIRPRGDVPLRVMSGPGGYLPPATTIVLPYLGDEVPVIFGPHASWYVPVGILCQLLNLDASAELRRARRVLLWHMACLLPLRWGSQILHVWGLPYPLGVDHWFGQVYERVQDPKRRQQLDRAIHDGMQLSALAFDLVQAQFEDGRTRIYRLAHRVVELKGLVATLLERLAHTPNRLTDEHKRLEQLVLRQRALADQAETFLRAWIADKAGLPIVDAVRVDERGKVLGPSASFTLFGTISAEERDRLADYERAIVDAIALLAPLAGDQGLNG